MNLVEILKMSRETLLINRGRAFLTVLGVIIGVTAVILMVSIGEGARKYIRDEFSGLGSNILVVVPGRTAKEGGTHMGTSVVRKLSYDDALMIKRRSRSIEYSVPVLVGTSLIKHKNRNRNSYVVGVTENYFAARNLSIDSGRFINESEVDLRRHVVVMGRTVKREIFGDANPLGSLLTIGESKFRVVGLMAPKGVTLGFDIDDIVFVPVTAAMDIFDTDALFNITVKVRNESDIPNAKKDIRDTLIRKHAGEEDFTILSQDEMLNVMEKVFRIMTAVLAGIASVSLIVGGIGIMNIMLVSVKERTREIGLRKAVGAKRRDILLQFMAEAVVLSMAGGLTGIFLGSALSLLIPVFITFLPTKLSLWAVLVAFFFSAGVGIFFGVYPARRAASLDPINALRYE
ncbi:MAG: FtsX-like permease family protein [Nitrospiraceae bacterium]|nr:MAG: FtsX-like permease family protein [Nitrospiraceae bacterium]